MWLRTCEAFEFPPETVSRKVQVTVGSCVINIICKTGQTNKTLIPVLSHLRIYAYRGRGLSPPPTSAFLKLCICCVYMCVCQIAGMGRRRRERVRAGVCCAALFIVLIFILVIIVTSKFPQQEEECERGRFRKAAVAADSPTCSNIGR